MIFSLLRGLGACLLLWLMATGARAAPADLLAGIPFTGAQTVPAEARPGGNAQALRMTVVKPVIPDYGLQLSAVVPAAVQDGQVLRLHFWGRSATRHPIRAVFEKSSDPYTKSLNRAVALTPRWTEYAFVLTTPAYPAGGAAVHFVVGAQAGPVELAGIALEDYGVQPAPMPPDIHLDLYGGAPHDDSWRAAADARIRRYRMGGLRVRVVDAHGKPVSRADVQVRQTRHAFRFGTALAYEPLFAQTPDGEKYRQTVLRLFNYVVLENALKWGSYGSFDPADKMLTWCQAHNLPVRGHNLFWPSYHYLPADVRPLRGPTMRQAVHDHVMDYVSKTKGRVVVWDVVNEAVSNHEVYDEAGKDLIAQAYVWAHETDSDVALAYNDNTIFDMQGGSHGVNDAAVDRILHYLIDDRHAPVTELGIQSHMGLPLVPAPYLLQNLDHWDTYGLPIEITEFDASIPNDAAQAAYFDEFLTAIFSHPQVKSFVMWGFWAGAHWLAAQGGAIINKDWTPRPAERVYERRVFHDWWTHADGKTDRAGVYALRAFLGDYQITATQGRRTQTVPASVTKNEDGQTVVTVTL